MDVEDFFSSQVRMRLLKILMQVGEINVSQLTRRLGVNYKTTKKHLKILENEGMANHKTFGRIHLFRINPNSPKTKAVRKLIEVWEQNTE